MEHYNWSFIRPVNYYETDKMAIVHHSNHIRWLEEARLAYSAAHGISYFEMEQAGILMPVTEVSCKYKTPLQFGQTAEIFIRLAEFNGVRAEYEYKIVCVETGLLALTGRTGHCFLDEATRAPINLKKRYPEYYEIAIKQLQKDNDDGKEQTA